MAKAKPKRDEVRENRIEMEIVVDCYNEEERAMGWFGYLQDQLEFPFTATCIEKRSSSPLRIKDKVEVIDLPGGDVCDSEMFVTIRWDKDSLDVPLSQVKPIDSTGEQTKQGVEDWHYWLQMGYEF